MSPQARQWTATIAAAIILAYMATVAVTEVRNFALWSGNSTWLCICALVCGVLLALISDSAARSLAVASVLAVLIFAGLWSYIFWSLLGEYVSFFEFFISDIFFLQVLPQCMVVFGMIFLSGLLGVMAVTIFVPERFRQ